MCGDDSQSSRRTAMNAETSRAAPTREPGSRRVIAVAILGDVAIAGSKFVAAALTGSSAMLAEGIHSLVDTGNELLLLYGVRRGRRAMDEWHPFGYGKATYVWSLIVALSVFSVGGGITLYGGIAGLTVRAPALTESWWNYAVLALAGLFEGWSWRVTRQELNRHRRVGESLWAAAQRNVDVLVFTVFIGDCAALIGIGIAAIGIGLSHAFDNPYFDPAASVVIGVVLVASAALLARKSVGLLVGESIDTEHLAAVRKIIAADPAVEKLGHLQTMRLGPENVLLIAAVRFQRRLSLDEVEQAIERLEHAIKTPYPSIHHLYLESGALKEVSRSVREAAAPSQNSAMVATPAPNP